MRIFTLLCFLLLALSAKGALAKDQNNYRIDIKVIEPDLDREFKEFGRTSFFASTLDNKHVYQFSVINDLEGDAEIEMTYGNHRYYNHGDGLHVSRIVKLKNQPYLAFEITAVNDGVGLPFSELVISSTSGFKTYPIIAAPDSYYEQTNTISPSYAFTCQPNAISTFDKSITSDSATFCESDLSHFELIEKQEATINAYLPKFDEYLNQNFDASTTGEFNLALTPLKLTSTAAFEQLLNEMQTWFSVSRISTELFTFVQVQTKNQPVYENFAYSFVKLSGKWHLLYSGLESSKGYFPLNGISKYSQTAIKVEEYCFKECDWWGQTAHAVLDFKKGSISFSQINSNQN